MKKAKKILTLALCAALLVCISVGATVAYLTATTGEVKNTFTVGKVTFDDPETPLKDGLTEAKTNEYGEPVDANGNKVEKVEDAPRVNGNEYKLLPGHTYTKDPTVTVAEGSEPTYVRMFVMITDMQDIKKVFGNDFLPQDFVNGTWDGTIWLQQGIYEAGTDYTIYEFWYKEAVDARTTTQKLPALFTQIKIPDDVTNDELLTLDEMEIHVVAQAIQSDGFANQEAAWDTEPALTINNIAIK